MKSSMAIYNAQEQLKLKPEYLHKKVAVTPAYPQATKPARPHVPYLIEKFAPC
jgi:hypothetical protein